MLKLFKFFQRQQRVDNAEDASGEDDLENFTTIDSVGEGDGKFLYFFGTFESVNVFSQLCSRAMINDNNYS